MRQYGVFQYRTLAPQSHTKSREFAKPVTTCTEYTAQLSPLQRRSQHPICYRNCSDDDFVVYSVCESEQNHIYGVRRAYSFRLGAKTSSKEI